MHAPWSVEEGEPTAESEAEPGCKLTDWTLRRGIRPGREMGWS